MTATLTVPVDEAIEALVATPGVSDTDVVDALHAIARQAIDTATAMSAPLTHAQRGALFGAFTSVFGHQTRETRRVFCRLVLGKAGDAPVSWADFGIGTLTQREASKVLDALAALEASVDA